MTAAVPYRTVAAAHLKDTTAPLRWLADGLFLRGGAGILGGAPKSCKSFFALDLCVAVASKTPCASTFAVGDGGRVTLLCAEDPDAVIVERLDALARARGLRLRDLPLDVIVERAVRLPEGAHRLAATIAATRPALLLLDPLIRLHRADENSAAEMSVILDGLRDLARTSGTAVLLVHHARKAPGASAGAALRGSSDLHAFGDTNLYLRRLGQDATLELKIEHRATACPPPLRIKLSTDDRDGIARFHLLDATDRLAGGELAPKIVAALEAASGPVPSRQLRETLGVRNEAIGTALRDLEHRGRVRRVGREGWTLRAG